MRIEVNGTVIAEGEIARETQYHPAGSLERAQRQAAQALVVRELLLQRAARLAIAGDTDELRIAALMAREVQLPEADETTCRRFFESKPGRFRSPDLIEARHILFLARPDDEAALTAARAKAESIIALLTEQPGRFADLARELSACSSASQGGNLGQLTRGSTVPEMETFLFTLEAGQLCPVPVRSRYGFHVLQVQQRIAGVPLPFEAVREKIAAYLEERALRMAVRQYITLLVGSSHIAGIDLKGASSPLVQ